MGSGFAFRVTHRDGLARRGVIDTPHGPVDTPVFMPVGTRATVKGVLPRDLAEMGARIVLGNTYHLYLRPGDALIARQGGLHRFMGWDGPTLTDSGGYQVFSLGDRCRLSEAGAEFRSHLDGSTHLLTPESAVDIQARLGADIAMVLDECTAFPATPDVAGRSLERTARWAARARARHLAIAAGETDVVPSTPGQAQFGIIQGGVHDDLRRISAEATIAVGFEGYAIGGLSVGEPVDVMYDIVGRTTPHLPADQPRYLMGTGMPDDLVESVARGIDMFDCVLPTRNAQLLTRHGPLHIRNARYADDPSPVDDACRCCTCLNFSRAYLRHLASTGEMLGATLGSMHNLFFYLDLMEGMRKTIEFGSFEEFRQNFHRTFSRQPLTR